MTVEAKPCGHRTMGRPSHLPGLILVGLVADLGF